jgi:hypothetical protein
MKILQPKQINNWKYGVVFFPVGIVLWLIFLICSSPRLPSGDISCFKDSGINFAQGRGLLEVVTPGNPTLEPKFYCNYPPLFPFLYGLYSSQAGVSERVDEIFSFIISALATVVFWFFVTIHFTDRQASRTGLFLLALLLMMLPVGPLWTQRERPDLLGFIFIMISLWPLRKGLTLQRVCLSAFLAGIGCLVSPFSFVINAAAIGCLILVEIGQFDSPNYFRLKKAILLVAAVLGGLALPLASLFLIQWLNDPQAPARFIANAMGKTTGGQAGTGYFASMLAGDFKRHLTAFSRFDSLRYKWMLLHLLFTAPFASFLLFRSFLNKGGAHSCWQAFTPLLLALVPLIVFPYQPCYMSLTASTILILFSILASKEKPPQSTANQWLPVISIGFLSLVAIPFMLREFIAAFQARETYHEMLTTIGQIRSDPKHQVQLIASKATFYFLFKQAGFEVVEVDYLKDSSDIAKVDLFAFHAVEHDGHSPSEFPAWWKPENMEVVHLPRLSSELKIFNWSISKINLLGINIYSPSAATWEPALYRFKSKDSPNTPTLKPHP